MTTKEKPHDDPTGGGLPTTPPVGPVKKITDLITGIKVFVITMLGIALKFAWSANTHFTDYDKLHNLNSWHDQLLVTFNGFLYGLIPGAVLGLIVVLAAVAGPELWSWLGPIILVAAQKSMSFLRGMSRAFRGLPAAPRTRRNKTPGSESKG